MDEDKPCKFKAHKLRPVLLNPNFKIQMPNECQSSKSMVRQAHHGFYSSAFSGHHPESIEG
jgi:hypothetical protein